MTNITFQEYCEEIIDQHIGLMSEEQRAEAYAGYRNMMKPKAQEEVAAHPDAKMKVIELKAKIERLIGSQKITIDRTEVSDLNLSKAFVEQAEAALNRNPKKAELLELVTLNSEASRYINKQLTWRA